MSPPSRRAADRQLAALSERYHLALCAADGSAADAVVEEALGAGIAPTTIQVQVIMAAMRRIGESWKLGELTVADEHAATGLCYRGLLPLQDQLQIAPPRSRERVVLAAIEGQTHVMGLRMVADVLEGAGFQVLYLGSDVPSNALRAFVAEHMPAIVGLTSAQAHDAPHLAQAIVAIHEVNSAIRIMLGGDGVPREWRDVTYPWVPNAAAVMDTVERLLEDPPQEPPKAILRMCSTVVEPPRPSSASDLEEQRLAAEITDTSAVARRYARLAAEYHYLAYRDPLTALPNRRAFEDRMIALSNPKQHNALLVIDVDEFKEINDTQGHGAGDMLLVSLARAIAGAVRAGDTVARVGGDEFTVLLPLCTQVEAGRVAEKIRRAVLEVSSGEVTVSIGAAPLGVDRRGAVLDADRALYTAKAAGRNRTELASAP